MKLEIEREKDDGHRWHESLEDSCLTRFSAWPSEKVSLLRFRLGTQQSSPYVTERETSPVTDRSLDTPGVCSRRASRQSGLDVVEEPDGEVGWGLHAFLVLRGSGRLPISTEREVEPRAVAPTFQGKGSERRRRRSLGMPMARMEFDDVICQPVLQGIHGQRKQNHHNHLKERKKRRKSKHNLSFRKQREKQGMVSREEKKEARGVRTSKSVRTLQRADAVGRTISHSDG